MLALGTSGGSDIVTNGAPKANMSGCNMMSDANATCNGHNLGAPYGIAHGTNNGCGVNEVSNAPVVPDPYSGLASNIPVNNCGGSYPQEPANKKGTPLPAANQWTGNYSWSGNKVVCGDQQLTGNVTINATGTTGAVLVIENGQLDTNGNTLTSSGSGLTVVFTGTNAAGYTSAPTGGGTLNIAAPTSGVWSGIAIYQDPSLTNGVNISAAGNSPTWDISGVRPEGNVYLSIKVDELARLAICGEGHAANHFGT